MPSLTAASIRPHLQTCGYSLLRENFPLTADLKVPLVAFASPPADARSACIAVVEDESANTSAISAIRGLGAPVIFRCRREGLEWWKQSAETPERIGATIPPSDIPKFFGAHKKDFSPNSVYRAKTWGRYDQQHQLWFVDLGLMPLVEGEIGERLVSLIVRNVDLLKSTLKWTSLNEAKAQWLLKSVFWLISAKILRDKSVGKFKDLDLLDVPLVFDSVAEHFGTDDIEIANDKQKGALSDLARDISQFSSLELATTESLAYVYENTLVSKATRKALGTHSTPAFLVDYIVGRLGKDIEAIAPEDRNVFEPACGHAAFLVSAMRYLTELLPEDQRTDTPRRNYLRKRMHGIETDAFALEIARLSLSLTDIPNPNGWDLKQDDMFVGNQLEASARKATIFLANPPFENFDDDSRRWYADKGVAIQQTNKACEMFRRALPQLPEGAVIGLVGPQTLLQSHDADDLRRILVEDFELTEVGLLPDKVFHKADSEPAIILGVKRKRRRNRSLMYSRVREHDYERFKSVYEPSFQQQVDQKIFADRESHDMRFAELSDVWSFCEKLDPVEKIATLGQGFQFKGESSLPRGARTYDLNQFAKAHRAFIVFDVDLIHKLPTEYWANLDDEVIRRPHSGTVTGEPQVLINYAPVSRGPWRLKALLDRHGHAVASRFTVIRRRDATPDVVPLEFLWALFNNPLTNAYAYAHLTKRDVIVGAMRKFPIPNNWQENGHIVDGVKEYFSLVKNASSIDRQAAKQCLLRVDAAVLKLYKFPEGLERQVVDLFSGFERPGVPFTMNEYIPRSFDEPVSLQDYIDITDSWAQINRRRSALIRKKVKKEIAPDERTELIHLQLLADYRQRLVDPLPLAELERISKALVGQQE